MSDSGSSCDRAMVPCSWTAPPLLPDATAHATTSSGPESCSLSGPAGRSPQKAPAGALFRRPGGRSGGGRVVRLLGGSAPRSLVGAVRPFDRVLKTHMLDGGPSLADINMAVRRLEGRAYPWLPAAPAEPEEPETEDDE
jgi:hypothetical protein